MQFIFFIENQEYSAIEALLKWNLNWKKDKYRIQEILEELLSGGMSPAVEDSEIGVFLSTLLFVDDEKIVEMALRNLYRIIRQEDDDENYKALSDYCGDAFDEKRELVRGRKHWISIAILERNNRPDEEIESYVRRLKGREESGWVWERIFGVLGQWNESFRIYPELLSWNLSEESKGDNYRKFVQNSMKGFKNTMVIQQGVYSRISSWVQLALDNKINYNELDWLFLESGNTDSFFPLPVNIFETSYRSKDEFSRIILLHYLSCFLVNGLFQKAIPYFNVIQDVKPLENNLYENMARLLIETFSFMEGQLSDSPFSEILDFLNTPINSRFERPEIYHAISSSFSPLLLRLITDKTVQLLELDKIKSLLNHKSAYYQVLAATLLLHSQRNGYDISSALTDMKQYIKQNPEDKNTFASGSDLKQDDFTFNYQFGSPMGFLQKSNEGEDKFFNLGGLTGLLEMCQPPVVSFRVGLALREYAEIQNDSELLDFLAAFSKKNEALKNLKPVKKNNPKQIISSFMILEKEKNPENVNESTPVLDFKVDVEISPQLLLPGPMKLSELVDMFETAALDNADIDAIAAAKREEIEKKYRRLNINKQHDLIRQIFSETEKSNDDTKTGHYASIFHRIEEDCDIPLDHCTKGQEGTSDYLACYLPQNGIDKTLAHRYGIYFNVKRCITMIKTYNLNVPLFIRSIAVHELFHALMDLMLDYKQKYHSHAGSSPSYCRLEEAAADFMAYNWLMEQNAPETDKDIIIDLIFKTVANGGISGYGEYELMDAQAAEFLPGMILDQECHILPEGYRMEKLKMDWGFNIQRQKARQLWSSLLRDMDEEVIPFYFDC